MASSQRRAQDVIRRRGNEKCPHHRGQNVVYKCNDCQTLACVTCATTLHRRHELDEISDVIPDIKRKMHSFITSTENDEIPKIQDKIKEVKVDLTKNRQYYKNLISDIEKQRDILRSELDDMTNGLIQSCRDLEQGNEEILLKQSAHLQTMIDELNAQNRECKDALQFANDVKIYDISNDIPSKFKDIRIPVVKSSTAIFSPGKLELGKLKLLLGELSISRPKDQRDKALLQHQPNEPSSQAANWSVVSKFTPYEGYIPYSMCAAPDNQIWMSLFNSLQETYSNTLLLVNTKGSIQQTLDMDVSVRILCLHPIFGNVWFISADDNAMREVKGSKTKRRFTSDGDSLSICISREDNIYIGQIGGIVVYTNTGKVLRRTEGDDSSLVRSPGRITLCPVTGNIAVADYDQEEHGGNGIKRVLIMSHTLQLLHRYHGDKPGHKTLGNYFDPFDVCYNAKGEVTINDKDNGSVILVNQKGDYLQTLYTDSKSRTLAVSVQANGDISVSLLDGHVIVLREV